MIRRPPRSTLFLFTAPAPTEIYTLSLHDALPISQFPKGRVEARSRDQGKAVLGRKAERLPAHVGDVDQTVVLDQDAFGHPRRSRGVNDIGQILGRAGDLGAPGMGRV